MIRRFLVLIIALLTLGIAAPLAAWLARRWPEIP